MAIFSIFYSIFSEGFLKYPQEIKITFEVKITSNFIFREFRLSSCAIFRKRAEYGFIPPCACCEMSTCKRFALAKPWH